jgi:hypothetical protein
MRSAEEVATLVEREVEGITDSELVRTIRELLVAPYPVERDWDYGAPGEHFTCWTVLEHRPSNTAIAYCLKGFGPSYPWGLVFLSGPRMSIGMDCGWFASLECATRDSMAWDSPNPQGHESH